MERNGHKMKKTAALILSAVIFIQSGVSASILGSALKDSSSIVVGEGLTLYKNTFLSDQKSVGNQTEYYAEYTPNEKVRPVVITGDAIYGKRNAKEAVDYMNKNNMIPMIGINASFFSFETGIPMGHVITDGTVTSKDNRTLPAIGFGEDGKGFIDDLAIVTTASFGEKYMLEIPHINKYISNNTQMLTLFTPDFGAKTGTSCETLNVVLENLSDSVRIGTEMTCTVKESFTSKEPVEIGSGEYILSVNVNGNQWAMSLLNTLSEGDEITIKTTANSEKWNGAYNGLASEGAVILKNSGVASGLEAGAAPRTAVGITKSGNIIFYVIDGRQSGYSYGARQDTVAKRLKELGCTDALNLDGGGSTTMAGVYPGCDTSVIVNSPSEGSLRKVTNFIFLENVSKSTGNTQHAYIYPYSGTILSGSSLQLDVRTVDENYYKTETGNVEYSSNSYATVSDSGVMTALGEGKIDVTAETDGASGTASFKSVISPSKIKLYNADNSKELSDIYVMPGDTLQLKAQAYYDGSQIFSSNEAYRWTVKDTDAAQVTQDGKLTISRYIEDDTALTLKAGTYSTSYNIILNEEAKKLNYYPYSKISAQDGVLNVDMYTRTDSPIDAEKSYIKIDGQRIELSECSISAQDDKHICVQYPIDEESHKIYTQAVTESKHTSINTYSIKGGQTENVFADTVSHWANDIISYMNKNGIVTGSQEDGVYYYRPDSNVTRAEFALMTARFLGLDTDRYADTSLHNFSDFDKIPIWAENGIKAVYAEGIIKGSEDNGILSFKPNDCIKRAESITIISRLLPSHLQAKNINYSDVSQIPAWALEAFKVLSSSGLLGGYDDNTVKPNRNVTRAEAVTMFYNIY